MGQDAYLVPFFFAYAYLDSKGATRLTNRYFQPPTELSLRIDAQ